MQQAAAASVAGVLRGLFPWTEVGREDGRYWQRMHVDSFLEHAAHTPE